MIAVLIQVPIVVGRPQLDLPEGVEIVREGRYFHISWGDGQALSLFHIGTPASGPVLIGQMTKGVAARLVHLGAKVMRLRDAWANPTLKTWLMARGVVEQDGKPRTTHVIAGSSQVDEDEENPA